ncbi:CotH kinase family protein, partial [Chitinophagales bacterium]|nr:CotH kinase family protein [Chitinophagales bacterium]
MRILLLVMGLSLQFSLFAQNLPAAAAISEDGRILQSGGAEQDGLYDQSVIHTIGLQFDQANWWNQLEDNYEDKINIAATMTVDGETFAAPVGVRFRGQTSYTNNQNSDKNSFNITIDYEDEEQDWKGYETLNLQNAYGDRSFMRDVLFHTLTRRHIPSPQTTYVQLELNGESWGIYPMVQQPDGDYIRDWFLSNDGTRWRADGTAGMGGGGPGGGPNWGDGTAALNFLGLDIEEYQGYYNLKKTTEEEPWGDLVLTCNVLENSGLDALKENLPNVMDVDKTLWFLATEILFSDDDSYIHKGKMDYYLHWEKETGLMVPLQYDGNSVMAANKSDWGLFYNADDANYPLLNLMLQVPEWRQRYLAHIRVLMADIFDSEMIAEKIAAYDEHISDLVQADTKKIYNFNQFKNEQGRLVDFVDDRTVFLNSNVELNATGAEISNVIHAVNGEELVNPTQDQEVLVRATIAGGVQEVTLYYAFGLVGNFTAVPMAGEGNTFTATIPSQEESGWIRYYIETVATDGAATRNYSPPGAEHDVYIIRMDLRDAADQSIVINEIMASNSTSVQDEAGEFEDWIELFNTGTEAVDLTGWHLTDNTNLYSKWEFPAGTTLGAGEYLIIWADEDSSEELLHANFRLSSSGESVLLINGDQELVDKMSYEDLATDVA